MVIGAVDLNTVKKRGGISRKRKSRLYFVKKGRKGERNIGICTVRLLEGKSFFNWEKPDIAKLERTRSCSGREQRGEKHFQLLGKARTLQKREGLRRKKGRKKKR